MVASAQDIVARTPSPSEKAEYFLQLAHAHERQGECAVALSVIHKGLQPAEQPDSLPGLLLAAGLCARLTPSATSALALLTSVDGQGNAVSSSSPGLDFASRAVQLVSASESSSNGSSGGREGGDVVAAAAEGAAEQLSLTAATKREAWHVYGVSLLLEARRGSKGDASSRSDLLARAEDALSRALDYAREEAAAAAGSGSAASAAAAAAASEVRTDLALLLAEQRQVSRAVEVAKEALSCCPAGGAAKLPSLWLLLALLLSSQQRWKSAAEMCRIGLSNVPRGGHEGVAAARGLSAAVAAAGRSLLLLLLARVQHAAGEFVDAVDTLKKLVGEASAVQKPTKAVREEEEEAAAEAVSAAHAWLAMATFYASLGKTADVRTCLDKAQQHLSSDSSGSSPTDAAALWHVVGLVAEQESRAPDARDAYACSAALAGATSRSSSSSSAAAWAALSKQRLATLLLAPALSGGDTGSNRVGAAHVPAARAMLQEAVSGGRELEFEPQAWFLLGLADQSQGDMTAAANSFRQARLLSEGHPIMPYHLVPPTLSYGV